MTKKTRELIFYTTRVNDQLFNLQLSYFHLGHAVALPSFERFFQARDKFRADYVAYKKLGIYDFPQKEYKTRIQNAIMLLLSKLPAFRREVNKRMKKEMIKPLLKEAKKYEHK